MTLRFILAVMICIAIAVASYPNSTERVITHTGRELDLAIVGRGYFCIYNSETGENRYTKSGRFQVDAISRLTIEIDGEMWVIDPPTSIPSDWERIAIHNSGDIEVFIAGGWPQIGALCLATFSSSSPFEDPLAANLPDDTTGTPTIGLPSAESGSIQQGWLESYREPNPNLCIRVVIAILAAVVLARATYLPVLKSPATKVSG